MNWKIRLKNPVFWVQVLTGALATVLGVQRSDRCGYDHVGRAVERYYRRVQQSVLPVPGGKQYLECAE